MANYTPEQWNGKKTGLMVKCFECFAEYGLLGTGIRKLAEYSGCTTNMLYTYFDNIDDLIIQSTEYCMSKVENEFMAKAPKDIDDLWRFIDEIPHWTAREHGKKYRLMYQVYTHPRYREYGKKFFEGVDKRYTEYADRLADKLGISAEMLRPMIFVFIRACVHYAICEDEFYLQEQLKFLKTSIRLYVEAASNA